VTGVLSEGRELSRRGEGSGEPLGQGLALTVDDALEAGDIDVPGLVVRGERDLEVGDVTSEPVLGQGSQQVVLAGIPPIESADAHPCPLGDVGHRRIRVGQEDLSRGVEDATVVPHRLRLTAAQWTLRRFHIHLRRLSVAR
jgi:hypothetical protein